LPHRSSEHYDERRRANSARTLVCVLAFNAGVSGACRGTFAAVSGRDFLFEGVVLAVRLERVVESAPAFEQTSEMN
jgi:hypothetical protein